MNINVVTGDGERRTDVVVPRDAHGNDVVDDHSGKVPEAITKAPGASVPAVVIGTPSATAPDVVADVEARSFGS